MSNYCVLKGTKISLLNGTIQNIENLKIGDQLIVFNIDNIANTQDEKILQNIRLNNFNGLFKTSRVKNIWTNQRDHYFIINEKLKITGDHIILVQRNKTYYWMKVDKLQINDLLFTEQNIFELITKIEEKNENVKVYNIQVDTYYNYFANQYLIHNGAPCTSCNGCGSGYVTGDFNWSAIKGDGNITRSPTTGDTDSLYKTATLSSGGTISYTAILAEPQLLTTESATIWIKVTGSSSSFYFGLLNDSSNMVYNNIWSGLAGKTVLEIRHAATNDRITFHSAGYINHSGHPDSSSGDNVTYQTDSSSWTGTYVGGGTGASGAEVDPPPNDDQANSDEEKGKDLANLAVNVKNGYGNILDETCGSGDGVRENSSLAYNRHTINGTWYSKYNMLSNIGDYIGMEIIYYDTITGDTCTYNNGESIIILHETNPNAYPNVKDGMRITGTSIPAYTYIDRVYRNYTTEKVYVSIVKQTGGAVANSGGHDDRIGITGGAAAAVVTNNQDDVSVRIYGQRLTFKGKDGSSGSIKTMGPSRGITLPQNWATSNTATRQDIEGWAIIIGDTAGSNTNTFQIEIQDSIP